MKCHVVLLGEGKTQALSCIGELNLTEDGFSLSYIFDGDSCILTYDGRMLRHEKSGEIPVCIEFVVNGETLCRIGSGKLSGTIPVFTTNLKARVEAYNVFIDVAYELDGENKQMQISAEVIN